MAQNDKAVITAAVGYVFIATPGTPAPTPAALTALDPETFGAKVVTAKSSGAGPATLTLDSKPVANIPATALAADVQVAIDAVLGEGSVLVSGVSLDDTAGVDITFIGAYQGRDVTTAATAATITTKTAVNGWSPVGHTSRNDMPEFGFDGGDSELKGTWQNAKLREQLKDTPADFLTLFLHQFDTESFELYYGPNASSTPGVFGVDGAQHVNERAFLVIIVDGTEKVGFYAPKASVKRDDSIQMPVDDFASLPIKATFLKMPGRRVFDWINEKLFS